MSQKNQHSFVPAYSRQIATLRACEAHRFRVLNPRPSCPNGLYYERFTLLVPYCSMDIEWEVLLNSDNPEYPPDFITEEGEEDCIDLSQLKSVAAWDPHNSRSLLNIVLEMREQYKVYQNKTISEFPDVAVKERHSLVSGESDLEFRLFSTDNTKAKMKLLYLFTLTKISDLTGVHHPSFVACFSPGSPAASPPQMKFIPNCSDPVLSKFQLAPWSEGTHLVNYVMDLEDGLTESVASYKRHIDQRKLLLEALLQRFGRSLEMDTTDYRSISFFLNFDKMKPLQFDVIVLISIGLKFPQEMPKVTLMSLLHTRNERPYTTIYTDYPYSPRWGPEEFSRRLSAFLARVLPEFKSSACAESPGPAASSSGPGQRTLDQFPSLPQQKPKH